jgi:hypothetical protein
MTNLQPSKIALKLATEAKSCGLEHDTVSVVVDNFAAEPSSAVDCNGLVSEAFDALLDEIDEALPLARFDRRLAATWAQAGMDHRLELASERRAFSSHF